MELMFHIKMFYDERFSRYLLFFYLYWETFEITTTSVNGQTILETSEKILITMTIASIVSYAYVTGTGSKFQVKMLYNEGFRKWPETSEKSLINMTVESILSNTSLVCTGSKFHMKMLCDEQFSRYLWFLTHIWNFRKLTETFETLRRTRFFTSSNDIPHYMHSMFRSSKIRSKMLHDVPFSRRQLP